MHKFKVFLPLNKIAFAGDVVYVDRKADAVFVIDATGSMGSCIESVKTNLSEFIRLLDEDGVDVRTRFVVYRDITCCEATEMSGWFTDTDSAVTYLQNIRATGGGDGPETPFDGIGQMFSPGFGFRTSASRFCILLTDADYKLDNNRGIKTVDEAMTRLRAEYINTSVITDTSYFSLYNPLVSPGHAVTGEDKGILANIYGDYSILLMNFASTIINSVKTAVVERMEPYFGEVGISHSVKVIASNLSYADDFAVTFDGKPVEVLTKEATYFTFNTPADKPVGNYPVEITNGGGLKSSAGDFMVLASPEDDEPFIYGASPYKFEEGVHTKVVVNGRNFINPTCYLGTWEMEITSWSEGEIIFKTGTSIPAGRYQLKVVNNNGKYAIAPEYFNIYYGEMSEPHTITSVSPSSFKEHTEQEIIISGTKFVSPTVTLGGKELEVLSSTSTQITCKVDTSFSDGNYDLMVTCKETDVTRYGAIYINAIMLATPVITNVTAESGYFLVKWTAEEGETFEVFREDPTTGFSRIGTTKDKEFMDKTASTGKVYNYYVRALAPLCGDTIESKISEPYEFGVEDLTVPVITDAIYNEALESVGILWEAVENANSYDVYRSTTATGAKTFLGNTETTSFGDTTVSAKKRYFYFVRAKNSELGLVSGFSSYKEIVIPKAPETEIDTPVIESATAADGKVTLTIAALDGADSFKVYRATTATGAKTVLGSTATNSFEDTTVAAGKKYFYFVKAIAADGTETGFSSYKTVNV